MKKDVPSKTSLPEKEVAEKNEKSDVIEIPIGRFAGGMRENPWIVSTFVLGIAILGLIIYQFSGSVTGEVVGEDIAAENLVSFIESQNEIQGDVVVVSTEREGQLYKVVLDYQGQSVPLFVTLDGKKWVVGDLIPLDGSRSGEELLPDTPSEPVNVELGDAPVKGEANAPATIVEFSDYECPFCGKFYTETLPLIQEQYIKTGKVKLVYKDFPLDFHPSAQKAAEAARCVGEQKGDEGYWKMHDLLFENQQTLSVANYKKWARSLGVVGTKFDQCLDEGKYAAAVQADLKYGQKLGVSGTPSFFINGKMVTGSQPFEVFKQVIDAELGA